MKNKNILIITILILGSGFFLNINSYTSKKELNNSFFECTPSNSKAKQFVAYFLQMDQFLEQRIKSGTEEIPVDQITHVEDYEVCNNLNAFVSSNDKLKHDELNFTRYYYQVSDFYFIFYKSNQPRMGITKFIVVDKDYKLKGVFGL